MKAVKWLASVLGAQLVFAASLVSAENVRLDARCDPGEWEVTISFFDSASPMSASPLSYGPFDCERKMKVKEDVDSGGNDVLDVLATEKNTGEECHFGQIINDGQKFDAKGQCRFGRKEPKFEGKARNKRSNQDHYSKKR